MRPLRRPMFRTGGPIKEGVMNGLKDGGVATYMADATGYAGGGRAALVGNPIFPKGPDGRAMHNQTYTIGGRTFTLPTSPQYRPPGTTFGGALKGGLNDTRVAQEVAKNQAQNLSRTKRAMQGAKNIYGSAKNIYNKIPFKKYLLPTAGTTASSMASPLIAGAATGYGIGKVADYVTRAYDTPKAYALRKQIMKEDPFTFDETNLEVGDALARIAAADKIGKKPGLLPRGGYKKFLEREGIDAEGKPIVEKKEEEVVVPGSTLIFKLKKPVLL